MTTIHDITRRDHASLTPHMQIRRAVAQLVEVGAPAAPVVDDSGRLIGILTQKDCFKPAVQACYYNAWKGTVGEYMTREVVRLAVSTDLVAAAEAFQTYPYRVFPVMEGEQLVGMLRRSDVLAQLLKLH